MKGLPVRAAGLVLAAVCAGCTPPAAEPPAAGDVPTPDEPSTAGWVEHVDGERGIAFRHPRDFGTQYIRAVDWPPAVAARRRAVRVHGGRQRDGARGIGGRRYCVTRVSGGAAGSVYTMYAYAFELDGDVAILTFSARAVQCGNCDEPPRSECEAERAAFDPDALLDAATRTLERRN